MHFASLLNQNKDNNKFKNKKKPELPEIQMEVHSNGSPTTKELKKIHSDRRDGDRQPGREDTRQGSGWQTR